MARIIMTAGELARRHRAAALLDTVYMYACYGWPVRRDTIARKAAQNLNGWYTPDRIAALQAVADRKPPVWGFDCVNLTKGILWGWRGDETLPYGGAVHASNGVPDLNADGLFRLCEDVSDDFTRIQAGEALWLSGHWGLYVGGGLAVECTSRWRGGVQVTAVLNIGRVPGHEGRVWSRHGKLPWVSYGADEADGDGRALSRGMKGEDVEKMQRALMEKGYALPRWGADGDFGPETETALRRFQEDSGLKADGVFGRAERGALYGGADKQSGPAPADPMAPRYAVTVRGLGQSDMLALTARWPGAEVTRDE